jgi:hypothetical protein
VAFWSVLVAIESFMVFNKNSAVSVGLRDDIFGILI